jgi:hypothetical protein
MASLDQRDLVKCVRKFRTLDDELKTVNTRAYKLREDKKFVESEMGDILKRVAFAGINKLEIQDDGSYIKVQRPETWNKPWSLGARDLQVMLDDYFRGAGPHTSTGCHAYIVNRKKSDMVAHDFSFRRVMLVDDNNDDTHSAVGSNRLA